jgi:hypothetical protein
VGQQKKRVLWLSLPYIASFVKIRAVLSTNVAGNVLACKGQMWGDRPQRAVPPHLRFLWTVQDV